MSNPAKNDITGDRIKTKAPSSAYRTGWERIFEKPQRVPAMGEGDLENVEEIKAWENNNQHKQTENK